VWFCDWFWSRKWGVRGWGPPNGGTPRAGARGGRKVGGAKSKVGGRGAGLMIAPGGESKAAARRTRNAGGRRGGAQARSFQPEVEGKRDQGGGGGAAGERWRLSRGGVRTRRAGQARSRVIFVWLGFVYWCRVGGGVGGVVGCVGEGKEGGGVWSGRWCTRPPESDPAGGALWFGYLGFGWMGWCRVDVRGWVIWVFFFFFGWMLWVC